MIRYLIKKKPVEAKCLLSFKICSLDLDQLNLDVFLVLNRIIVFKIFKNLLPNQINTQ